MKKAWLIMMLALFGLAVIGGYAILDNSFPKAAPIDYPNEETVIAISLAQNNDTSIELEASTFIDILQNIRNAEPTRKMSVNDYPTATTYYTIGIKTAAREYQYFIYAENSNVYIEIPYEGIYKANQQFLGSVADYFND